MADDLKREPAGHMGTQLHLGQLQALVLAQGQQQMKLTAQLAGLRRQYLNLAHELCDFSRQSGAMHCYAAGRTVALSEAQRKGIARLEDRLARGEYRMAPRPCPCGAHADQLLAVRDRYGIAVNTVICRACGLMRIDPYYTPETLTGFYSQEYDAIYGRGLVDFSAHFARSYQMRGAPVVRNLRQRQVALEGRRVYEIGCGGGWILKHFQELGCTVIGVDYDEAMVRQGRELGLDLRLGGCELLVPEPRADVIILSHVLEHIPDLQDFLAQVTALLAPGGVLYVCVPTLETLGSAYGHNLFFYLQNAHVYCFSLPTLTAVLERAGLSVTRLDDSAVLAAPVAPVQLTDCSQEYARIMALLQREESLFLQGLRS